MAGLGVASRRKGRSIGGERRRPRAAPPPGLALMTNSAEMALSTSRETTNSAGMAKSRRIVRGLVQAFHDHRHPLAAADAHRLEPGGLVLFTQTAQQRAQHARPAHPERVAKRDRAAVRVELVAERVDPDRARRR